MPWGLLLILCKGFFVARVLDVARIRPGSSGFPGGSSECAPRRWRGIWAISALRSRRADFAARAPTLDSLRRGPVPRFLGPVPRFLGGSSARFLGSSARFLGSSVPRPGSSARFLTSSARFLGSSARFLSCSARFIGWFLGLVTRFLGGSSTRFLLDPVARFLGPVPRRF